MTRRIILKPTRLNEEKKIRELSEYYRKRNKLLQIDDKLLFWEHHFEAFETGYPNGYKKIGTIRYRKGHIRVPFGMKLPVFETQEYRDEKPPRGIATIDYVVACHLYEVAEGEWLHDGFTSQEDLFEQMKAYYPMLTPESVVSYYKFKDYNSNPSEQEVKELLEIFK